MFKLRLTPVNIVLAAIFLSELLVGCWHLTYGCYVR
jgi:hypothetical protein